MRNRNIGYSFLCGTLVFVAVLVLLIQALGVPFWWAFGIGNTQDGWWIIAVSPENPRVGENVTIGVAEGIHQVFLMDNATVTITRHGMQTLTIYTDKDGEASFLYPGDATVIRVTKYYEYNMSMHSLYVTIPRTPLTWVRNCWIAISGATVSGLLTGIATVALQRRSWTKHLCSPILKFHSTNPKTSYRDLPKGLLQGTYRFRSYSIPTEKGELRGISPRVKEFNSIAHLKCRRVEVQSSF